jgi:PAS domain S-box-containing protein
MMKKLKNEESESSIKEALIASEMRYRRLFETAQDGILILDAETGMILDVNPFLIDLLGYSKEDFIDMELWEIGFFKDIAASKEKFNELQRKENVRYENLPLETFDGHTISVEFISNVYVVNKKKLIQCNIRDISKRKGIEVIQEATRIELEENKVIDDELSEFAENIINTLREPLLMLDKDLRIVKANLSFYNFFMVTPNETIGKLIYELGNNQWDIPQLRELLETILPQKTTFDNYEVEHEFFSLGKRVMLLNARQIKRAFGLEKIILLAFEDVTKRRIAEEKLLESETKFRNIFENSPLGKSLTGVNGSLNVNKAFCDILGYSEKELKTKKWQELTHPDDIQESIDIVQSLIKGEKTNARYEKRYIHKNGRTVWADVSTTLQRDKNNIPLFFITVINDITGRKKAEEQLKISLQNLERSNKELEQFAYVASHDLQEPLRMVSSYTQLLERRYKDKLDQDANDFIQFAVDGANRMQKLINDLLDYSRITARGKEFAKVDISQVLGQVVSNLHELIIENNALVTNDDLPEVYVDESQILRVFQNLIQNALKFKNRAELPKIHISCKKKNDFYEFSVSDNGIGMGMQYHDRVFTIFQRLHSKEEYPGTGIGLSICKRIIERHGGKIWFESKENEGTTFYFTLKV